MESFYFFPTQSNTCSIFKIATTFLFTSVHRATEMKRATWETKSIIVKKQYTSRYRFRVFHILRSLIGPNIINAIFFNGDETIHSKFCWIGCRTNSPTSARYRDDLGYIRICATPPTRLVFWGSAQIPYNWYQSYAPKLSRVYEWCSILQ